jgi:hypothetical protein
VGNVDCRITERLAERDAFSSSSIRESRVLVGRISEARETASGVAAKELNPNDDLFRRIASRLPIRELLLGRGPAVSSIGDSTRVVWLMLGVELLR